MTGCTRIRHFVRVVLLRIPAFNTDENSTHDASPYSRAGTLDQRCLQVLHEYVLHCEHLEHCRKGGNASDRERDGYVSFKTRLNFSTS